MTDKIAVPITDAVADTLFIPLYMRHLETLRDDAIISDPKASELVGHIDYDFEKFTNSRMSQVGTAIRVRHFDREAARFVREASNPVVISIGAGLDTRFERVYSGKGVFYELDLPEVIDFRKKLMPPRAENPHLAVSMFDTDSWVGTIKREHPGAQFMIIAEGVFMYFTEEQLRPFLVSLTEKFEQAELHFDACNRFGVKNSSRHDTVKKTNAQFLWALDDDAGLSEWTPKFKHVSTERFMNQERRRWGLACLIGFIPGMKSTFRILRYDILS